MHAQVQIMPYLPNGSKNNMKGNPYQIYQVYRKQDLTKHLQNLLRFLFREINFFIGKKNRSGNILSGHQ